MPTSQRRPRVFRELRITVGRPGGCRSGSYRAWERRGSFYIKPREAGPGDMKVSVHPDMYLVGWQEKWARANPAEILPAGHPPRVSFTPTPARSGITRVLTLLIPAAAVNWREPCGRDDVVWLPPPAPHKAVEIKFALVTTPIELSVESLVGCVEGRGPNSPDLLVAYREIDHVPRFRVTGNSATAGGQPITDSALVADALPYFRAFGMGELADGSWFLEDIPTEEST